MLSVPSTLPEMNTPSIQLRSFLSKACMPRSRIGCSNQPTAQTWVGPRFIDYGMRWWWSVLHSFPASDASCIFHDITLTGAAYPTTPLYGSHFWHFICISVSPQTGAIAVGVSSWAARGVSCHPAHRGSQQTQTREFCCLHESASTPISFFRLLNGSRSKLPSAFLAPPFPSWGRSHGSQPSAEMGYLNHPGGRVVVGCCFCRCWRRCWCW